MINEKVIFEGEIVKRLRLHYWVRQQLIIMGYMLFPDTTKKATDKNQ